MSQFYVGVKQIFAWREDRESGDGGDGYHVVYDHGTSREYHSWSPLAVFEAAYLPMGVDNNGDHITQAMVDGFVDRTEARTGGGKMTVLDVTLANGTVFAEFAACVNPENYDMRLGRDICERRAKDRVWQLLGFALQWARDGINRKKP